MFILAKIKKFTKFSIQIHHPQTTKFPAPINSPSAQTFDHIDEPLTLGAPFQPRIPRPDARPLDNEDTTTIPATSFLHSRPSPSLLYLIFRGSLARNGHIHTHSYTYGKEHTRVRESAQERGKKGHPERVTGHPRHARIFWQIYA